LSSTEQRDLESVDYFFDPEILQDPYPYYDHVRARGPVAPGMPYDAIAISGYEEAVAVFNDPARFSNCNSMSGPFNGLVAPEGTDDITALVEAGRDSMPMSEHLAMMDPPKHTKHRALLMRLITPKRLKENEAFMWELADRTLDEFAARGECEFIGDFTLPYSTLVIAELLGVPESDRDTFRNRLDTQVPGVMDSADGGMMDALAFLYDQFTAYVVDRREQPRDDVITGLATATFPDGSLPEPIDVVRIAAFLFAAGGETTARLLATSLRVLAEDPELQERIRGDRELLPNFIEETLRWEGPVKTDHRLTQVSTTLGGVDIPAGATISMMLGAANRDPRRFENPDEFVVDRANARQHIAFGHGVHTCPGAPLARAEARVALERVLDRMHDIRISDAHHGPAGARAFTYAPTFVLRGMRQLFLEYTPA
jgi:cytochrome P450 family 150 subfamily A5